MVTRKHIRELSWKVKTRLALGGWALLMIGVYRFAIAGTLDVYAHLDELQCRMERPEYDPGKLDELRAQLNVLNADSGVELQAPADTLVHEQLLNIVTGFCQVHTLTLREFDSPVRYRSGNWMVETHPFTVEGSFIQIVQFLRDLQRNGTGKIVSADIYSKRDSKTKSVSLLARIYVQNILTVAS